MNLKYTRSTFLAAAPLLAVVVQSAEVVYEFHSKSVLGNRWSPDCQNVATERRWLFLVKEEGGEYTMPGPTVEANEGDTVIVRFTNDHDTMGATIHWHGIHQIGTPWMDGPAFVTQCPLGPLQTQEYRFEAYPPGTHYWHAHAGLDVADGFAGPIIVHPKTPPPYTYDEERVLFLQDFFSETGTQQSAGLDAWPFVWIGTPDSLLINGKGFAPNCQPGGVDAANPNICQESCADKLGLLEKIQVQANKTYRLRVINSSQLVAVNFGIKGHKLKLVEAEGTVLENAAELENYDIPPGSRADFLITTDQTPGNYLIETAPRERNFPGLLGQAILNYEGVDVVLPVESPTHPAWDNSTQGKLNEKLLFTKDPASHPEYPALQAVEGTFKRYVLLGSQNAKLDIAGVPFQLKWSLNGISNMLTAEPLIGRAVNAARSLGWPAKIPQTFDMPMDPPIVYNYTGLDPVPPAATPLIQQGTSVIRVTQGEVFEIVLQNTRALNYVSEIHPWHSHGYSFWVVGQGDGNYDRATSPSTYNTANPMLRDNAALWPLGWTALRFYANNPGVWYFHCHIPVHLHMGMALSIVVSPDVIGDPSENVAFCGKESLYPVSG